MSCCFCSNSIIIVRDGDFATVADMSCRLKSYGAAITTGGRAASSRALAEKGEDRLKFHCTGAGTIHIYRQRPDLLSFAELLVGVFRRKSIVPVTDPYVFATF